MARSRTAKFRPGGRVRRGLIWIGRAVVAVIALQIVLIVLYTVIRPPVSTLMLWRLAQGHAIERNWVPMADMGRHLPLAAMAAEDARFCQHQGVDWSEVQNALDTNGGRPRGASTISMQTMKNLFLWPARSYLRKAAEVPLAFFADLVWSKRRMMEIYLNIAEWGPGIYGAGAAAQTYFGRSPDKLTKSQAARLAAALPNPFARNPGRPGPQTRRIARVIERRMAGTQPHAACLWPDS